MSFSAIFRRPAAQAILLLSALAAHPQSSADNQEQALIRQGQAALQAQHYQEAQHAFEQLSTLDPASPAIQVTLGVILFKENQFAGSITHLRRALQLKPGQPRVESLLAMALSETGRYEEALPGLERGFHQTADTDLRRMCGLRLERAYNSLHRDAQAVQVAAAMNEAFPSDPEVLYYSGKIFGNAAFLSAQKLFSVAPRSPWGLMAAAEAREAQGDTDAAIAAYQEVLRVNPEQPNVHYRIARTLLARAESSSSQADLERAMQEFQQELAVDPTNANAAYELGEHFRKAGQYPQAEKYFSSAISSYPQFEEAHVGLAAVYMAQNRPKLALPDLKKAVSLDPGDPVAWYRLALAERAVGDTAGQREAMARFQQAKNHPSQAGNLASAEITPQQVDTSQEH